MFYSLYQVWIFATSEKEKKKLILYINSIVWSILVTSLECRFLDTKLDGSIPGISMLCP